MKCVNFNSIYAMGPKYSGLHVQAKGELVDADAILRAELVPSAPLEFKQLSGSKARDLIGTAYGSIYLFSSRVIDLFRKERFSGWETFPVIVYGRQGERIEGYHGFSVTGRCGPIDESLSKRILLKPKSPEGRPVPGLCGWYFDPESWDGSDIFLPEGWTCKLVVERVKRVLKRAKVTNVYFEALADIEIIDPVLWRSPQPSNPKRTS